MSGFAELLRRFRESRSLTQGELAARAGLTPKAVGALERGERRRPFPHTVRALADALELNDADRDRLIAAVPPVPSRGTSTPARRLGRPTQVIGRETAVEAVGKAVNEAVAGSGRSIVTLTGPGGVGKTTLAQLAAAAVRESHSLDVVVVELADVRDAAGVVPAVAAALGVPDTAADGVDSLVAVVGNRRLLLVLDNVEHVLECVPDVLALTTACPALGVLATSRVPMRVRAEREIRVGPLDHDASIQLFRELWNAAGGADTDGGRDDATVARLCRQADGLPLALELTAVAASRFGLRTLLASIDAPPDTAPRDLPQRQRSMTATLDWSARLLSEPARTLLTRLSVCVGGFTWFDARAVGGLRDASASSAFAELVEHSLVVRGDEGDDVERFRLLEPVRQYAAGHLDAAESDAARAGLADAVLATARDLAAGLHGPRQLTALQRLEAGLGNLRVALGQLISSGRHDDAAELLWLVWLHLAIRGHAHEGGNWAARLRPLTRRGRIRLLIAWAGLDHLTAPEAACRRSREALALATAHADDRSHDDRSHDEQLATQAATLAASTALFSRDIALADALLAEANRRADELDDPYWVVHARMATTQIALLANRASEAEAAARAAESTARRLGSVFETAAALNLRAVVAQRAGRDDEAAVLLAEAIELAVAAANSWTLTYMLSTLATTAVRLGDPEAGAQLFGAWSAHASAHGVVEDFPTTDELVVRDGDRARRELGVVAFDAAHRTGREAGGGEIVALARRVRDRAAR